MDGDMKTRVVITGVGLTAPNGNDLAAFRKALLEGKSGVRTIEHRYVGKVAAGLCDFDETRYQSRKARMRGTRAGSIAIYCAHEALKSAGLDPAKIDLERTGVSVGITEHGTVETDHEIHELIGPYKGDVSLWSQNHNPRSIANAPAGEVTLNLRITGPHCTIGGACAAGNLGLIHGVQLIRLGEVDRAIAGGVSESARTFSIFAAFRSQHALAEGADASTVSRPLDRDRKGIVVSEGGCLFVLESLESALKRGARIFGEVVGYHVNSDATDFVLPNAERQAQCMRRALEAAGMKPEDVDVISLHATGTQSGDVIECDAVRAGFGADSKVTLNCTKGLTGHTMGAAGALELAGNLPGFGDGLVHPCGNLDNPDEKCRFPGLVIGKPAALQHRTILNNSFGMLGINSVVVVRKYEEQ
jgi:3-oxoacyl-[acyl-carrier-protein] synthase II